MLGPGWLVGSAMAVDSSRVSLTVSLTAPSSFSLRPQPKDCSPPEMDTRTGLAAEQDTLQQDTMQLVKPSPEGVT